MFETANPDLWFFVTLLPVCLIVAFNDLKYMKIPNVTVLAMVAVYIVVGLLVLPLDAFLWRFVGLVVALVAGFLLSTAKLLGAGDVKFMAAGALFIAPADVGFVLIMLALMGPVAILVHRLSGRIYLKKAFPDWESWQRTREFPMGLSLTATLLIYLGMAAVG